MNNIKVLRLCIFIAALMFFLVSSSHVFAQANQTSKEGDAYSRMLDLFEGESTTVTEPNGNGNYGQGAGYSSEESQEFQKYIGTQGFSDQEVSGTAGLTESQKIKREIIVLKERNFLLEDRLADVESLNKRLARERKNSKHKILNLEDDADELRRQNIALKEKSLFLESKLEDVEGHDFA